MVDVISSADTKALINRKANQPPTAGTSGQVLTRDTSSTTGTSWQTPAAGSGGSSTAPDATSTTNGVVRLAGDLAGTAAAPTLKQIYPAQQTVGSSTVVPVFTIDVNGRIAAVSTAAVSIDSGVLDQLVAKLVTTAGTATRAAVQALSGTGSTTTPTIANTTTPTVTGTGVVGSILTASTGAWNPNPDQYLYQWRRDGNPISGQTATTYTVLQADVGTALSVAVRAAKSGYVTSDPALSGSVTGQAAPATTTTTNYLLTESGDFLVTESGDRLVTT